MKVRNILAGVKLLALSATTASAHVSEQGFVLLLPTGAYTSAGVAVVCLTVFALFFLPDNRVRALFEHHGRDPKPSGWWADALSLVSLGILFFLIYLGLFGPRDPLSNLMPLSVWTVCWVGIVSLAGLLGSPWRWLNPWTGLYRLIGPVRPALRLPEWLGVWPSAILLLGFAAFLLADWSPDDPTRLAYFAAIYWLVTMAGLVVFGPNWFQSVELGRAVLTTYGQLAAFTRTGRGGPGWQILVTRHLPGTGVFALLLLGVGSFDGLNETFWWLGQIGVNPLEFPGRSAVVLPTFGGLLAANALLIVVFGLAIRAGLALAPGDVSFATAFGWLALSLLPIAWAYHIAHYLTSFLVNIQYTVGALNDPFARGADLLGLEPFRVTTGFFNRIDTVRVIWLVQAGVVVIGHVWSVLLAHRIAMELFPGGRRAALATLPLSIFMIAYTFLGLWLLAAPKGA